MKKNGAMMTLWNDETKRDKDDVVWKLTDGAISNNSPRNTMPDSGAFVEAVHTRRGARG
jgi:hypothetical protein